MFEKIKILAWYWKVNKFVAKEKSHEKEHKRRGSSLESSVLKRSNYHFKLCGQCLVIVSEKLDGTFSAETQNVCEHAVMS